jgi:DNA repair protein RadC
MVLVMASLPPHERPRERLLALGAQALSERELLALVLRNGTRGVSALDLASSLLAEYGGLRGLAAARPEELADHPGVGLAKSAALVAALQLARRSQSDNSAVVLRTADDVARVAQHDLDGLRRERVLILICDAANRLRKTVVASEGSIDRSFVPVREILNAVLRNDGRAFAIAHNHPSGDPEPSDADRRATLQLKRASGLVGLRFLGHVTLAGDRWAVIPA